MGETQEPHGGNFRRDQDFDANLARIIADAVRHFDKPVDEISGSINRRYKSATFSDPSVLGESSNFFKDKTNRTQKPDKSENTTEQ